MLYFESAIYNTSKSESYYYFFFFYRDIYNYRPQANNSRRIVLLVHARVNTSLELKIHTHTHTHSYNAHFHT